MGNEPHDPAHAEHPPGYGIDRTLIRRLLDLTPAERLRIGVESARNVAELFARLRRA